MEAAAEGIGATRLLYYQVIEAVRAGSLMILLEQFELTPPCPLPHAALGQMPLKMRWFLDFSAPRLREALAQLDTPRSVTPIPGIGSRSLSAPLLMTGFDPLRSLASLFYGPLKSLIRLPDFSPPALDRPVTGCRGPFGPACRLVALMEDRYAQCV